MARGRAQVVVAVVAAFVAVSLGAQQPPGVRVSGIVVDAYPGVLPLEFVTMLRGFDTPGFSPLLARTTVRENGSFVFDGVAPGRYSVSGRSGSELEVTVGTRDVTGLRLRNVGLVELFPSVRMDDGSEVPARLGLTQQSDRRGWAVGGSLDPDRTLFAWPGRRFIFVVPPDGLYVESLTSAGVDLLREPLVIHEGAPERSLNVVLTRVASRGRGRTRVVGRIPEGVVGARSVHLTPTMPWPARRQASSAVPVGPDGSFAIDIESGIYDLHVPPAYRVVTGIVVPESGATVDLPLLPGRLFGGNPVRVIDPDKRSLPYRIGPVVLVARGAAGTVRVPVETIGFWGSLKPGEHRLTLENLPPDVSIAVLEAGGRNLLNAPYVVPADREPPRITLVLHYAGPVPDWVRAPVRNPEELLRNLGR